MSDGLALSPPHPPPLILDARLQRRYAAAP